MVLEVLVVLNLVTDFDEGLEKGFVVAVIEALTELLEEWDISVDGKDIGTVHDLGLDGFSVLGKKSKDNSVEDEVFEAHELYTGKRGDGGNKKVGSLLELSNHHAVNSFEDFELILLIPICAIIDKFLALSDVLGNDWKVVFIDVHEENCRLK